MRLLFDQNLSYKLCHRLADLFPGSTQARLIGLHEQSDRALWDFARQHGLAIVSYDADFAEMAALFGRPPAVIWLRCGNQPTAVVEQLLRQHAEEITALGADEDACCLELY